MDLSGHSTFNHRLFNHSTIENISLILIVETYYHLEVYFKLKKKIKVYLNKTFKKKTLYWGKTSP